MDAEELSQTLIAPAAIRAPRPLGPCCAEECAPFHCRTGCALELIGRLLSEPGAVTGEEADYLLDLHQAVKKRQDAEGCLRSFCDLRRRLESRHYLIFYRLRRWLENQILVRVQPLEGGSTLERPLRLQFYCVEAVRRSSLCDALAHGLGPLASRLSFAFRS